MSQYNLVADVSSHNPDSLSFFRTLANRGVTAVIVKLTEGSNPGSAYANPKAANQIHNAKACGLRVNAYHFARFLNNQDAILEANWFLTVAKRLPLERSAVMAVDCESGDLPTSVTSAVNAFITTVKQAGYHETDVYSSASWFWSRRLIPAQLIAKNLWVANYGVNQPGLAHVGTWQFTDNWQGLHVDMSYDFFGHYTKKRTTPNPARFYQVRPGDSWWLIAHNHGLTMNQLATLNGTTIQTIIHPGQQLRVK